MGIFLANRDAPSRCTATDCLVVPVGHVRVYVIEPACKDHLCNRTTFLAS